MKAGNVRLLTLVLYSSFFLMQFSFAQETADPSNSARPKKVLTPEQNSYQEHRKDYMAKRLILQAQAKEVFEVEAARENAGDCPDAHTTYAFNLCYGKELTITDQNLKSYEILIRELQIGAPQTTDEPAKQTSGPEGVQFTPAELSAEFDRVEQGWRKYREVACQAAFHQFGGGTGGPSFELECELKLVRDHMRELDMIYGGDLHR